MARSRMSPVDTTWYRIESEDNPVDVSAVLLFQDPLPYPALRAVVTERLLRWRRFRQRVVESRLRVRPPRWVDVPDFRVEDHLQRVSLPPSRLPDAVRLQQLVGERLSRPLDLDRPPWELTLIDGVDGGCALLARLHHCIGDGFALAHALLAIADNAPPSPPPRAGRGGQVAKWLRHPLQALRGAGDLVSATGYLLALPSDPPTGLRHRLTGVRRVAWSPPMSLEEVKVVAHAHQATLNDILVAGAAGAVRRHLLQLGEAELDVRALVPVNLRPARFVEEMDDELGNRLGLVYLPLALTAPSPIARLAELKAEMARIKGSAEPLAGFALLTALGRVPAPVARGVGAYFARKASAVMTNVPGPRARLQLAGQPLTGLMFWVPHPVRLGLGVSLISYAGEVRVGIRADEGVCRRPEALVGWFQEELERLGEAGGVQPPKVSG